MAKVKRTFWIDRETNQAFEQLQQLQASQPSALANQLLHEAALKKLQLQERIEALQATGAVTVGLTALATALGLAA